MSKTKKNPNRITLFITERELEMLLFIQEKEGHFKISEAVHACIRNYYNDKYYTKYKDYSVTPINNKKEEEENLTVEQYCEKAGGKVVKSELSGLNMCFFQDNINKLTGKAMGTSIPLDKKAIKKFANL